MIKMNRIFLFLLLVVFSISLFGCNILLQEDDTFKITSTSPVMTSIANELFDGTNAEINNLLNKEINPKYLTYYPNNLHTSLNSDIILTTGEFDRWFLDTVNPDSDEINIFGLRGYVSPIRDNYHYWYDFDGVVDFASSFIYVLENEHNDFFVEHENQILQNLEEMENKVDNIINDFNEIYYSDVVTINPSFDYLIRALHMSNYYTISKNIDEELNKNNLNSFFKLVNDSEEINCLINDELHFNQYREILKEETKNRDISLNFADLDLMPDLNMSYSEFITNQLKKLESCLNVGANNGR